MKPSAQERTLDMFRSDAIAAKDAKAKRRVWRQVETVWGLYNMGSYKTALATIVRVRSEILPGEHTFTATVGKDFRTCNTMAEAATWAEGRVGK